MAILKVWKLPKNKDAQIQITINEMSRLVRDGWWGEEVRSLADAAVVGHFSTESRLRAMSDLVRAKMVFRFDPDETELIRLPASMAREVLYGGSSWGDCDDYSILLAAMVSSHGFRAGFVTMAVSPHNREFRHVFVAVALETGLVFLDPSVGTSYDTGNLRTLVWWIVGTPPPRLT